MGSRQTQEAWPRGPYGGRGVGISPRVSTLSESIFHSCFTTRVRIFTLLSPEHFRAVGQVDPKQD